MLMKCDFLDVWWNLGQYYLKWNKEIESPNTFEPLDKITDKLIMPPAIQSKKVIISNIAILWKSLLAYSISVQWDDR
jgi:hypothetical protein